MVGLASPRQPLLAALALLSAVMGCAAPEPPPAAASPRWDGLRCDGRPDAELVTAYVQYVDPLAVDDDGWVRMLATLCEEVRELSAADLHGLPPTQRRERLLEALGVGALLANRHLTPVRWAELESELRIGPERTVHTLVVEDPWFGHFLV